jgi:hypothetical protein
MVTDIGVCKLWHSVNMYRRNSRTATYLRGRTGDALKCLGAGSNRRTCGRRDNGDNGQTAVWDGRALRPREGKGGLGRLHLSPNLGQGLDLRGRRKS